MTYAATIIAAAAALTGAPAEPIDSFPLPEIPPGLTRPAERAEVVVAHFFDGALLPETPSGALQLAIANFTTVAPLASEEARRAAAATLYSRAANELQRQAVATVTEQYLAGGDSPYLDLDLYAIFLEAQPASPRRDALLALISANRPGSEASDIPLRCDDGTETRLMAVVDSVATTLLLFHDPDCAGCIETSRALAADSALRAAVAAGTVRVVAVTPGGDMPRRPDYFPGEWTVAIDIDDAISADDLYYIPSYPEGYVIGPDGRVIARGLRSARAIAGALGL